MTVELPGPDPTIHRRRLRSELRKLREAAGKTQRDVVAAMDWSQSKLIRIETGSVTISTNDLRALLALYGVTDQARVGALVDTARASREPPRWGIYRDVASPEFIAFLGYESSASVVRNFEPQLVPGLLQTEEYAREVITALEDSSKVDALVDLRMQRQEILVRPSPPGLHFTVDETVLRRAVGGPAVMRRQLKQLRELCELPHVTLRVMTLDRGLYPRFELPYVIFEFDSPEDEDVLYIERNPGSLVIMENSPQERGRETPVDYLGSFWRIEQAAPREQTPAILDRLLAELPSTSPEAVTG